MFKQAYAELERGGATEIISIPVIGVHVGPGVVGLVVVTAQS